MVCSVRYGPRMDPLHRYLERLYAATDGVAVRAHDPVAFVHRYRDPADIELAGLIAVSLAYGKVDLFFPVLDRLFATMDDHGGPAAYVDAFTPDRGAEIADVVYRWNRGGDFVLLFGALRRVRATHGGLEPLFAGSGPVRDRLARAVDALRDAVVATARDHGEADATWAAMPRGVKYLLPSPASGSACKRWALYLRWMVRPPREGVDFGVWSTIAPADLVMPVDVHVGRISRLVGLTERADASWRTAEAIAARLRDFDPHDPIRFDFALAHLGISAKCTGRRQASVCPQCPLDPICQAPRA